MSLHLDLETDFGTLDDAGRLRAQRGWFAPGTDLSRGSLLRVGDLNDAVWSARIVEIGSVWLSLELIEPIA